MILNMSSPEGSIIASVDVKKCSYHVLGKEAPQSKNQNRICCVGDHQYLFSTQEGIVCYNSNEQKQNIILYWVNAGIPISNRNAVAVNDKGDLFATSVAFLDYYSSMFSFYSLSAEEKPATGQNSEQKKTIVFGIIEADEETQSAIVLFNENNDKYQIELKCYMQDGIEREDAVARMNADIVSGNGPDLVNADDIQCVGYPCNSGLGSLIKSRNLSPAIVATTDCTDGCMAFLDFCLSDEWQNNMICYYTGGGFLLF